MRRGFRDVKEVRKEVGLLYQEPCRDSIAESNLARLAREMDLNTDLSYLDRPIAKELYPELPDDSGDLVERCELPDDSGEFFPWEVK